MESKPFTNLNFYQSNRFAVANKGKLLHPYFDAMGTNGSSSWLVAGSANEVTKKKEIYTQTDERMRGENNG